MNLEERLKQTEHLFLSLFVIGLLFIISCQGQISIDDRIMLQSGDLLFQDLDCGPFCEAVKKVTRGYRGSNFSHIGIVSLDTKNNLVVIEAISTGVNVTPLEIFLNRSLDKNHQPKVAVGRLKEKYRYLIPAALQVALALKGKPYDNVFDINNDAYCCSELIYKIFLQANHGKPVFMLEPMTFKDPSTRKIFSVWEQHFANLGVSVPEGKPGINPGSISRSPLITIIGAYGVLSKN